MSEDRFPVFKSFEMATSEYKGEPRTFCKITLEDGAKLKVWADIVHDQTKFNRYCFSELGRVYHMLPARAWADFIHAAAQASLKK